MRSYHWAWCAALACWILVEGALCDDKSPHMHIDPYSPPSSWAGPSSVTSVTTTTPPGNGGGWV